MGNGDQPRHQASTFNRSLHEVISRIQMVLDKCAEFSANADGKRSGEHTPLFVLVENTVKHGSICHVSDFIRTWVMTHMPWTYPEEEWCTWPFSRSPVPQGISKTNLKACGHYMFGDLEVVGVVVALGRVMSQICWDFSSLFECVVVCVLFFVLYIYI